MPTLAEDTGEEILLPVKTPKELFREAVADHPDNVALICRHQPAKFLHQVSKQNDATHSCLRWTYKQLDEASSKFAAALYASGIRKGMRIATFVHAGAQYAIAFYAAALLGCPFVPINPAFANKPDDVRHMLNIAQASVVLLWDEPMANEFREATDSELLDKIAVKILANEAENQELLPGWTSLERMLNPERLSTTPDAKGDLLDGPDLGDTFLIVFTSGTTSKPKGVNLTNHNWGSGLRSTVQFLETSPDSRSCNNLPLFHIFAILNLSQCWNAGATVCIPSATFNSTSTLHAIENEKLTQVFGPPALQSALLSDPIFGNTDLSSLDTVMLGASVILPDTVSTLSKMLGVSKITCGFGMSEGTPITFIPYRSLPYKYSGQFITSGPCTPGARLRVCEPGSRKIVQRGEIGELHMSGPQVAQGYLGGANGDFYQEEGVSWLATGDQVVMEENGYIFVMGRYKDVIIRGGENIAPASLETILDTIPGVTSQVVGVPDEVAGEVPAAIIKVAKGSEVNQNDMRDLLVDKLGTTFAPAYTLPVEDLGLEDFPKTLTGKVQKAELKALVVKHIGELESSDSHNSEEDALRGIWSGLLGISKDRLQASTSVEDIADSITVMRALGKIDRSHKVKISPQDIRDHPKIADQAQLLRVRSTTSQGQTPPEEQRQGPPLASDIVHTMGSTEKLQEVKQSFQAVANDMGLSWDDDVEDIVPIWDWGQVMLRRLRAQSWNHRHAFAATKATPKELRAALERALARQPMLRTLAIHQTDQQPLHAIIRPSPTWFGHVINEVDAVQSASDLRHLVLNDAALDFAAAPGPLFRAVIAPIAETGASGIVYQAQHSCFDALSLPNLIEDLNTELSGSSATSANPRAPYKAWADNYYLHRGSVLAQADCDFHVQRLTGLSKLNKSFWPVQRAPGWFKGNCADVGDVLEQRKPLDGDASVGVDGVVGETSLPGVQQLRQQHGFSSSSILKTALAILNTHYTKQQHAVFVNYEAGRAWPFQQPWIADLLPNAMEVNGPTLQAVLNKVSVDCKSSCLGLIEKVHEEQKLLTKHAHAPLLEVQKQLGEEDGAGLIDNVMRRQIFNWLPGLKSSLGSEDSPPLLERVQMQSRSDVGLLWNCGMVDQTFHVNASYDDAQLCKADVEEIVERYLGIAAWITNADNWSKPVAQCPAFS